MMSARVIVALAAAIVTAVGIGRPDARRSAQTARPTGSAAIVGRVLDAESGSPVTGALVTLSGPDGLQKVTVDAQGRFAFSPLAKGAYAIAAAHAGYLNGTYGQRRPDGTGAPLDLGDGDRVTDAVVKLWRFATISGTVTDDTGEAVPYARVQALRRAVVAGHWRLVNTGLTGDADDRGAYRIAKLPPGEYALVITSLVSSFPMSFAETVRAARQLDADSLGEFLADLTAKGSSGYASDVTQKLWTRRVDDLLIQASSNMGPLPPGSGLPGIYPTTWYPGAASPADAVRLSVRAGENRTNVDIRTTLTPAIRISGVASGPDGPAAFLALRLVPANLDEVSTEGTSSMSMSFYAAATVTDSAGAFTFLTVPGQYVIRSQTMPRPRAIPAAPGTAVVQRADGMSSAIPAGSRLAPLLGQDRTYWAGTPVAAGDTDVSGVAVALRPGVRVMGHVVFEGDTPKPSPNELRAIKVAVEPADGRLAGFSWMYQMQVDPDGAAYSVGLPPGRYLLRVDVPPRGWTLKSALVGGVDMSSSVVTFDSADLDGLVLTFTDRQSGVRGVVRNGTGHPDDSATVVLFGADGVWTDLGLSPRRLRGSRVSHGGTFAISGLPSGEYYAAAIAEDAGVDWQDPAFLRRLIPQAVRVTVADGQMRSIDLSTVTIR